MSKFGTGGSVKSWIKARVAEKGDERPPAERPSGECSWLFGTGPEAGPRTGPLGTMFEVSLADGLARACSAGPWPVDDAVLAKADHSVCCSASK